jgi:hypothetical protein
MAKQMPKHPIVPRETPTPMPIFLPLLLVVFAGFDDSRAVALGIVRDKGVVVKGENGDAMVGTKF